MARIFLDTLKANITTVFADNTTGDISAADLRGVFVDSLDSLKADEAFLYGDATPAYALTQTFAIMAGVYNLSTGDDGSFLKVDQAGGFITLSTVAGWSYRITGLVSFRAPNNQDVEFVISRSGTPTPFVVGASGRGNNTVSASMIASIGASVSNENIAISARGVDSAVDIDIQDIVLEVQVLPTNNP